MSDKNPEYLELLLQNIDSEKIINTEYKNSNFTRLEGSEENIYQKINNKFYTILPHKLNLEFSYENMPFLAISKPNQILGGSNSSSFSSDLEHNKIFQNPQFENLINQAESEEKQKITFKINIKKRKPSYENEEKFTHYRGNSFGSLNLLKPPALVISNENNEILQNSVTKENVKDYLQNLYQRSIQNAYSNREEIQNDSYTEFALQLKQIENNKELQQSSFNSEKLKIEESFDPLKIIQSINENAENNSPQTATELIPCGTAEFGLNPIIEQKQENEISQKNENDISQNIEELSREVKEIKSKIKMMKNNENLENVINLVKESNEYLREQYEETKEKHNVLKQKYTKVKDSLKLSEIDALNSNKLLLKIYEAFISNDAQKVLETMQDTEKRIFIIFIIFV